MAFKIYTKTGDKGETSLFGGKRLPKNDLRIEAYGTVDELNAFLGLVRDLFEEERMKDLLDTEEALADARRRVESLRQEISQLSSSNKDHYIGIVKKFCSLFLNTSRARKDEEDEGSSELCEAKARFCEMVYRCD